jgi:hypothetical protein
VDLVEDIGLARLLPHPLLEEIRHILHPVSVLTPAEHDIGDLRIILVHDMAVAVVVEETVHQPISGTLVAILKGLRLRNTVADCSGGVGHPLIVTALAVVPVIRGSTQRRFHLADVAAGGVRLTRGL